MISEVLPFPPLGFTAAPAGEGVVYRCSDLKDAAGRILRRMRLSLSIQRTVFASMEGRSSWSRSSTKRLGTIFCFSSSEARYDSL